MSIFTKAQHIGIAALIMSASVFVSRFMGLIRDKVISYYYGATLETDIYFASFVIPDFINYLLAGGYFSITLIPLMSRFFKQSDEDGWKFLSTVLFWVTAAILALTGIAWVLAPQLALLSGPGFGPEGHARLTTFIRIILPAQACFLPGACFTALLFMRRQFLVPALTPLIYNGCIILFGLASVHLTPERGMEGFLWGVVAGAALGSLVCPLLAARAGGLKLSFNMVHPGMKRFILLALPLMLGQSIVVLDEHLGRIFGSLGEERAVSLINYARRIMMVPVGVVAQAAGVASFPFLASLVASGDRKGFNDTLNRSLLTSMAVIIPLAALMMAAAEPTIRLIFEQGRFSAADTAETAFLLIIMLSSVGFWTIQQILGRGFYANENTLTPVLVGSSATILVLPLYWALVKTLGAPGVALAGVVSMGLYTAFLIWRWIAHYGRDALSGLLGRSVKLAALCVLPGLASWFCCMAVRDAMPGRPLLGAFVSLCAGPLVFALIYLAELRITSRDIWEDTMGLVLRRIRKKRA